MLYPDRSAGKFESESTLTGQLESINDCGSDRRGIGEKVIIYLYLGETEKADKAMEKLAENVLIFVELAAIFRLQPDLPIEQTRFDELRAAMGPPELDQRVESD